MTYKKQTPGRVMRYDTDGAQHEDTNLATAFANYVATLQATLTAARTYTLPDASGTLPLLERANIFTQNLSIHGAALIVRNTGYTYLHSLAYGTGSEQPVLQFGKSHTTTLSAYGATIDNEVLGNFWFSGVSSSENGFNPAAVLRAVQVGAAGASVVAGKFEFYLSTSTLQYYQSSARFTIAYDEIATPLPINTAASVQVGAAEWVYWGDPNTNGSWRQGRSGNNLVSQRRISGAWVTKQTITG